MAIAGSLRALLAGAIDYAGLFPPAKLPLDSSIRNYARYRSEPESWMLGRFICPAARLTELVPFVTELFSSGEPLDISALGRGGPLKNEFFVGLEQDVKDIRQFLTTVGERARVGAFETRAPDDVSVLPHVGNDVDRFVERNGHPGDMRSAGDPSSGGPGFKLRTGGVEASAFPSPEQVARAIHACRQQGVAMKFTAGLHHPVRHFNATVDTKMHGFLNVYVACILAHARQIDEARVRAILEDEEPGNFAFDDSGLRWKILSATTGEIELARDEFVTSFGSCSFDEPRDDLRALGLL